jgi:membrane protein DedA with SNARE-associated domain
MLARTIIAAIIIGGPGMSFFSLHQLVQLLHAYGNIVLGVVVGLESVGLPLPGETLLIAAAIWAGTTGHMNIALVVVSAAIGAIGGQMLGYWIGWGVGFRLLRRYGHYIGLTNRRVAYGRAVFRRHGVKVVFASRFIVLLRTLSGLLAGANRMPWGRFMAANIAGSVVWSLVYGLGAYFLGHEAKQVAGPIGIGIGLVVAAGLAAVALFARRRERQLLAPPPRVDSPAQPL